MKKTFLSIKKNSKNIPKSNQLFKWLDNRMFVFSGDR